MTDISDFLSDYPDMSDLNFNNIINTKKEFSDYKNIPKLFSKQNDAFWTIRFTKYLESDYPYHQISGKFVSWIIRKLIIDVDYERFKIFLIVLLYSFSYNKRYFSVIL